MAKIEEMAQELGEALGRTDEYQALKRASERVEEDRELVSLQNRLEKLEASMMTALRSGQEPSEEEREAYESAARDLQARPDFQRLVAAQANFEKLLTRVNETISRGIRDGSTSRIILPS